MSPDPFTTITASLVEDILVAVVVVLALTFPWAALGVAGVLLIGGTALVVSLRRLLSARRRSTNPSA